MYIIRQHTKYKLKWSPSQYLSGDLPPGPSTGTQSQSLKALQFHASFEHSPQTNLNSQLCMDEVPGEKNLPDSLHLRRVEMLADAN